MRMSDSLIFFSLTIFFIDTLLFIVFYALLFRSLESTDNFVTFLGLAEIDYSASKLNMFNSLLFQCHSLE